MVVAAKRPKAVRDRIYSFTTSPFERRGNSGSTAERGCTKNALVRVLRLIFPNNQSRRMCLRCYRLGVLDGFEVVKRKIFETFSKLVKVASIRAGDLTCFSGGEICYRCPNYSCLSDGVHSWHRKRCEPIRCGGGWFLCGLSRRLKHMVSFRFQVLYHDGRLKQRFCSHPATPLGPAVYAITVVISEVCALGFCSGSTSDLYSEWRVRELGPPWVDLSPESRVDSHPRWVMVRLRGVGRYDPTFFTAPVPRFAKEVSL